MKITKLIENKCNSTDKSHAVCTSTCTSMRSYAIFCLGYVSNYLWRWSSRESTISLQVHESCCTWIAISVFNILYQSSSAEKAIINSQFYYFAHLPGVPGLVAGTHIRIQKPSEDEADYVNRHFYHSINVEAICLPNGRFSDVLARFSGSVHDSRIWKLSKVGMYVENNFQDGENILGDSGHMLRQCLLTPYRQPGSIGPGK